MSVIRYVRELSGHGTTDGVMVGADIAIAPVVMPRDRAAVASLADEARSGTVSFSASGLVAELESREGRQVTAWIAWQSATLGPRPVGVVILAHTTAGVSIPWLLVDPDVRRSGIARALVGTAVRHADLLGATAVTADTLDTWPESVAFWPAVGFKRFADPPSDATRSSDRDAS